METKAKILSVHNLSKQYKIGLAQKISINALSEVSFDVTENEVFGIIGPNGAGKSTLLKIIMNFVRQNSGTVILLGKDNRDAESHQEIGYLPEHPSLTQSLTPNELLTFACRISSTSTKAEKEKIAETLKLVNLLDFINTPLRKFSKGMLQRTALAYSIILDPKVLILDEPMSGLDPIGRQLVIDLIQQYKIKGTTIIFCSHILSDIERVCDRIGIMHKGQLARIITPNELHSIKPTNGKTHLETLFLETIAQSS